LNSVDVILSDNRTPMERMELGECLGKPGSTVTAASYYFVQTVMREYVRTLPPGGGLALPGSLPREEDYGPQKPGEAPKERSPADETSSGGYASP
jgi:hypothetical protein